MEETGVPVVPLTTPERQLLPNQFQKGNPGPAGLKKGPKKLVAETVGTLEAMQTVLSQPSTEDRTFQQVEYRKWLNKNRQGFISKLADMEKAAASLAASVRVESGQKEDKAGSDEGVAKAMELVEKLLGEWEGE